MSSFRTALDLAAQGVPVFPCHWEGAWRKCPLTEHGFQDASCDPSVIEAWRRRWPKALIGVPTGILSGFVVLDIDVKHADRNGFDTLDSLGFAILPQVPMVHTASGGLHLYFESPECPEIRNTGGAKGRGIGPGLDWRGDGGYVIVPSAGSGYFWDPIWNFDTAPLAEVPEALLPRNPERSAIAKPAKPTTGLSRYAEGALDGACRKILAARCGEQEATLNDECFAIGTLAGAGSIPADFARQALIWVARQIPNHDPRRPWRAAVIERKIERAFADGMRHPRHARRA
jgi:putative DNA primase/helicase